MNGDEELKGYLRTFRGPAGDVPLVGAEGLEPPTFDL
jgi:hypothetical protein